MRYLRSESYRRALTFQKRYLLLLLGGFQFTEEAVLAGICRPDSTVPVNTSPSSDEYSTPGFRIHPLRKFRVAVKAVEAIHRLVIILVALFVGTSCMYGGNFVFGQLCWFYVALLNC